MNSVKIRIIHSPQARHYLVEQIVKLDSEIITALNKWRLKQTPVLEPNEAILTLIRKALTSEGLLEAPSADPALDALIAGFRRIDQKATEKAAE